MKSLGGAEPTAADRAAVLAHQGGWDEILLVVGPLAVVGLALWLANRRVSAQLDRGDEDSGGTGGTGGDRSGGEPEAADRDRSRDPSRDRDEPQR